MVHCPVCNKKVYVRKGKVIPHGSNEDLCYGSYMSARDCRKATKSTPTSVIAWFFHCIFNNKSLIE